MKPFSPPTWKSFVFSEIDPTMTVPVAGLQIDSSEESCDKERIVIVRISRDWNATGNIQIGRFFRDQNRKEIFEDPLPNGQLIGVTHCDEGYELFAVNVLEKRSEDNRVIDCQIQIPLEHVCDYEWDELPVGVILF